ncbi:MAG TPA: nucleotidyltransferase family protein [Methylococcaceae bacterium]|nr:nucleotidyltransferase family protein [Methylococcaceae bacterium]
MKAMILAAGRGERLRPLTDHTPKPLLMAGGKPLIQHTLEALAANGFSDIVVNLAWRGAQIREFLGDGARFGVHVDYSEEGDEALETGGGIRKALPLLGPGPFLAVNGDIATDYPFRNLRRGPESLLHLVLVPNPPQHPQGDFALRSRALFPTGAACYTFSGIGVYRPELFAPLAEGRFPLGPLLRETMQKGAATGELYRGFWLDVGTRDRLRTFDEYLNQTSHTPAHPGESS